MNPQTKTLHTLKIISATYITHDVKRFIVEKPEDYHYRPGQSVMISINKPDWKDEKRPFTFTSLQDWDHLEFVIKIYEDHDGVTNQMASLKPGDELLLHEVFGTIQYKGPGIFLADRKSVV